MNKSSKNNIVALWTRATMRVGIFVMLALIIGSCQLIDPTEVRNPQITIESLVGQPGSLAAARQGIRFAFSDLVDNTAYFTDVVSDNYDNWQTFISPAADDPRSIRSDDLTLNGNSLYPIAQSLRIQATFAITDIAPKDPDQASAPSIIGEIQFFRGMAALILGENFSFAPSTEGGPAISSNDFIDLAIADLTAALTTAPTSPTNIRTAAQFALARAHRQRGNKTQAAAAANAALALSATYMFTAPYDALTNTNTGWVFAVTRALNDIQPLPRLDFLDPKYTDATGISPIPALKAEEMYLILAEANLSDNDLATAKTNMKNAINVARGTASGRTAVNFADVDPRRRTATDLRPNADTVRVRANATSSPRTSLVKRRSGTTVSIKQLANTSVNATDVDTLVLGVDHLWMLYLLRQEIMFFEGRRMSDLGIRLPIMRREIETNPVINPGDPGTVTVVPAYIPAGSGLDAFTSSAATGIVTITTDMNSVLATNKVSRFPIPF